MIKYVLPAGVLALALGAHAAHAQMVQPMPPAQPYGYTTTTSTTVPGDESAVPGYAEPQPGYGAAGPADMMPGSTPGFYPPPVTPRTTWIPGHYNWDPNSSNYVWTAGRYAEAPTEAARWTPGHWVQTPTSWIWIEGGWK